MKVYLLYEVFQRLNQTEKVRLITGVFTDRALAGFIGSCIYTDPCGDRLISIEEVDVPNGTKGLVFCEVRDFNVDEPVRVKGVYTPECIYSNSLEDTEHFLSIEEAKEKSPYWLACMEKVKARPETKPFDDPIIDPKTLFYESDMYDILGDGDDKYQVEICTFGINTLTLAEMGREGSFRVELNWSGSTLRDTGYAYSHTGELLPYGELTV